MITSKNNWTPQKSQTDYSSCLVSMSESSAVDPSEQGMTSEAKDKTSGVFGWIASTLQGAGPVDSHTQTRNKSSNSIFLTSNQARESTDEVNATSAHIIQSSMFDEAWLVRTHARARTEGRRSGALIGACVGAIGLLALGPVLMLLCGIGGCLVGLSVGFLYDMNRARRTKTEGQKELRRLTYLVRFAVDQIHRKSQNVKSQTYCCQIVQEVIMEFKPLIMVASLSPVVLKKLKLFYSFIRDQEVEEYLWLMVNEFLASMSSADKLTISEFIRTCQDIFAPLVEVEKRLNIPKDRRMEVIVKIDDFLADPKLERYVARTAPPTSIDPATVLEDRTRRGSVYMSPRGEDDYGFLEIQNEGIVRMSSRLDGAFFRNFHDFMHFDIELKHKMPISNSEFKFLFEKETESFSAPGWAVTVEKKNIKVLRFSPPDDEISTSVLVRAYARIPNTSPSNVFYHIYDPKKRQSWDKNFSAISVLPGDECEILYCQLQAPFGVTPRDFLQYRKALNDGESLSILMRSAEHENHPHLSGFIRAESLISGYVIRQRGPDCDLFLMSQTDIKGLIPKWIVNMVAAKAPAQWVESLTSSCTQVLDKDFSGNKAKMEEFLDEFLRNATREPPNNV